MGDAGVVTGVPDADEGCEAGELAAEEAAMAATGSGCLSSQALSTYNE